MAIDYTFHTTDDRWRGVMDKYNFHASASHIFPSKGMEQCLQLVFEKRIGIISFRKLVVCSDISFASLGLFSTFWTSVIVSLVRNPSSCIAWNPLGFISMA